VYSDAPYCLETSRPAANSSIITQALEINTLAPAAAIEPDFFESVICVFLYESPLNITDLLGGYNLIPE
jgi:hypothetical protein